MQKESLQQAKQVYLIEKECIEKMADYFDEEAYSQAVELLKNAEQVHKCASAGCQCVTVTADVLKFAISHPMTDAAIMGFEKDWKNVYGEKTILDF